MSFHLVRLASIEKQRRRGMMSSAQLSEPTERRCDIVCGLFPLALESQHATKDTITSAEFLSAWNKSMAQDVASSAVTSYELSFCDVQASDQTPCLSHHVLSHS